MQISVEASSQIERRLTVIVPSIRVEEAIHSRLSKIAKTATVKGFRPGKAPLDFVKKQYGEAARQEALSEVIQSSLYQALNQEKLQPVSTPMVEPKMVLAGQPLEYIATFEVMPLIEKVNFSLTSVEREMAVITDENVDHVIEQLREQNKKWTLVERPAAIKDQVMINFEGFMDGVPFDGGKAEKYRIVLGSKMMIPGFEDGIIGMVQEEERTIDVIFPEVYHAKQFAGKKAQFVIKLLHVSAPELPVVDEAFVKGLGVQSGQLTDLKAEIKKNLEREIERLIKEKLKIKIFNTLFDQNQFDVPAALVKQEAERLHDQLHPHHGHEHHHTEAEMAGFQKAAKQNVMLGLMIAELVKQHHITIDMDRVKDRIQQLASVYDNPEEVTAWYEKDKKKLAEIEMLILEEQVVEKMLEGLKVTDKIVDYVDFIKQQNTVG